jgi:ABC-type amino acid transport substrate-binding protein
MAQVLREHFPAAAGLLPSVELTVEQVREAAKTEPALRDAIKGAMERLQSKGIYDQILAKYGLQGSKLTPVGVNQGK